MSLYATVLDRLRRKRTFESYSVPIEYCELWQLIWRTFWRFGRGAVFAMILVATDHFVQKLLNFPIVILSWKNVGGVDELISIGFEANRNNWIRSYPCEEIWSIFEADELLPKIEDLLLLFWSFRMQNFVHFNFMEVKLHLLFFIQLHDTIVKTLQKIFHLWESAVRGWILKAETEKLACQCIIVKVGVEIFSVISNHKSRI